MATPCSVGVTRNDTCTHLVCRTIFAHIDAVPDTAVLALDGVPAPSCSLLTTSPTSAWSSGWLHRCCCRCWGRGRPDAGRQRELLPRRFAVGFRAALRYVEPALVLRRPIQRKAGGKNGERQRPGVVLCPTKEGSVRQCPLSLTATATPLGRQRPSCRAIGCTGYSISPAGVR
jgi:hypothetical protein